MEGVKNRFIDTEKGVWRQFVLLLYKGKLPWIWILLSLIAGMGVVNIGISETKYTAQLFSGDTSVRLITQLVIVMLINWFGNVLVIVIRSMTTAKINRNLRKTMWKKILYLPMIFYKEDSPRETVSRITTDTDSISSLFSMAIIPFLTQSYTVVMILRELYGYNWKLMLTMLVIIPFVILLTDILGKLLFAVSKKASRISAMLTEQLSELVFRLPLTKVFAQEKKEEENGHSAVSKLYRINIKSGWISMVGSFSFSIVTVIQTIIMILLGRLLLINHEIPTSAWVAFYLFSGTVTDCMNGLNLIWTNTKTIQGSTARIAEIIAEDSEKEDGPLCEELKGDIVVNQISFSYQEGKEILKNFSCVFPEGSITALLGISGCGKSTLLNLLDRIYEPESGEIVVGGNPISNYEVDSYRRKFAVLTQKVTLFSGSFKENVCYGLNYMPTDEEIRKVFREIGAEFVFEDEADIYAEIGEKGDRLSGGQKQKIGIARAILSQSSYVLFDEAISALDASAVSEILGIIKKFSKNKTIIMIAHSPSVLSIADRCVIIENGQLSAQGDKDSICKSSQFFCDFVGMEVTQNEVE